MLEQRACANAARPAGSCTSVIQELVYGEERKTSILGNGWERMQLPKAVLKEVTIVDTPGTNSILRNHQTITENYIPQSDLVIFVFPAKNPHTGTAWELLALVRTEWHRKTVFILQQADLATLNEVATNHDRVKQYARERGVQNPTIFTVSAKREREGIADSGFSEFRTFLRNAVETGEVWQLKMQATRGTIKTVLSKLLAELTKEQAAIADASAFYQELLSKVEARRAKANSLQQLIVDSLCGTYDRLAQRLSREFAAGLGVGTVLKRAIPLIRDKDIKTWLKDLQTQFEESSKKEIEEESQRVSKDLAAEMQAMIEELTQSIAHRKERGEEPCNLSQVTDRSEILERLKSKLESLRVADIVGDKGLQASEVGNLSLAGGGLAAIGAIIATMFHVIWIHIIGQILAGVGAFVVVVMLLWKRTGILRDLTEKLDNSRKEFRDRLDSDITKMFDRLFFEVSHALNEPLGRLEKDAARVKPLIEEAVRIGEAEKGL